MKKRLLSLLCGVILLLYHSICCHLGGTPMMEGVERTSQETYINSKGDRRAEVFSCKNSSRKSMFSSIRSYSNIASYKEADSNRSSMNTIDVGVPKITMNDCRVAVGCYPDATSLILARDSANKLLIIPKDRLSFIGVDTRLESKRMLLALTNLIRESFQNQTETCNFTSKLATEGLPLTADALRYLLNIETETRHGPRNNEVESYQNTMPEAKRWHVIEDAPLDVEGNMIKDACSYAATAMTQGVKQAATIVDSMKEKDARIDKVQACHYEETIPLLNRVTKEPTPGIQGVRLLKKNLPPVSN